MHRLPDRHEQIRLVHAEFIRQVAETSQRPEQRQAFETLMASAEQNGWSSLTRALRRIADGDRGPGVFAELDEEDQVIAEAILRGIQDPGTLPDPARREDPTLAAPGLAHMIHAAASGNPQALMLVSNMAEQMSRAGGPLARLAGVIRPLINGERDPQRLCRGMDGQSEKLVLDILDELARLQAH